MTNVGWTGSLNEGNNKCKWKVGGDIFWEGDCVGSTKMDLSERGCWIERWREQT